MAEQEKSLHTALASCQGENMRLHAVLATQEMERPEATAVARVEELEESRQNALERCATLEDALAEAEGKWEDAAKEARILRYLASKFFHRVRSQCRSRHCDRSYVQPQHHTLEDALPAKEGETEAGLASIEEEENDIESSSSR
ncbi:hypothetical protein BSKO_12405 [Bryopsis sp. KO-2023]|nr:hypothetical protein BSKO_12405 [Bryopsis sp. KO-2023]